MAATARQMTKQIERYFAAVDAGDVDAIIDTLAPRCVLEPRSGTNSRCKNGVWISPPPLFG